MRLWRWNAGRQGTGYGVFPFFVSKWFGADCYLIKLGTGIEVREHRDLNKGGRHFRFNVHFGRYRGGVLFNQKYLWKWRRVYLFRPDESEHAVSKVLSGTLYIFSVGWLKPSEEKVVVI